MPHNGGMTDPSQNLGDMIKNIRALAVARNRFLVSERASRLLPGDEEAIGSCEAGLLNFVAQAWHILEPRRTVLKTGWALGAMCEHLEAVTSGEIQNLIMSVPPGMTKSLLTKVFWPAWEWGPKNMAYMRYVTASYSKHLSDRDALKLRRLVTSDWYQRLWPHLQIAQDQKAKTNFHTTQTGFMMSSSVGSVGTGARANRCISDDPNSVKDVESDTVREETNRWRAEVWPSRVEDLTRDAFIDIQQRVHDRDVTGYLLDNPQRNQVVLCLPMEYDPSRHCTTRIGFSDPRTVDGELLFPERFPAEELEQLKRQLGPYATAAQLQQTPIMRGGSIIGLDDWQMWDKTNPEARKIAANLGISFDEFPPMEFVIGSLDTAYTEEEENDYSANSILGIWRNPFTRQPNVMLMYAWEGREQLNPLVKKVGGMNIKYHVNKQLIEAKSAGHSVAQELRRLFSSTVGVILISIGGGRGKPSPIIHRGDKASRTYTVQHIWTNGQVWRPSRAWAMKLAEQLSRVPKGAHDDLADTMVMGVRWLRDCGFLLTPSEGTGEIEVYGKALIDEAEPLYDT